MLKLTLLVIVVGRLLSDNLFMGVCNFVAIFWLLRNKKYLFAVLTMILQVFLVVYMYHEYVLGDLQDDFIKNGLLAVPPLINLGLWYFFIITSLIKTWEKIWGEPFFKKKGNSQ